MSDPTLDALRAALAQPRDPDAGSYDPRKPRLAAAAREAYVAKQEPVTADIVTPATITSAVRDGMHTVAEIAGFLGVDYTVRTELRSTLDRMVADGLLVVDDRSGSRRFTLPQ